MRDVGTFVTLLNNIFQIFIVVIPVIKGVRSALDSCFLEVCLVYESVRIVENVIIVKSVKSVWIVRQTDGG
jgi:hypothetical protein